MNIYEKLKNLDQQKVELKIYDIKEKKNLIRKKTIKKSFIKKKLNSSCNWRRRVSHYSFMNSSRKIRLSSSNNCIFKCLSHSNGFFALAIAVLINTPSQPNSIAIVASDA